MNNSTIAAISTPIGVGGISIIRISGDDAFHVIKKIFKTKKNKDISDAPSHTIHFGEISYDGKTIDEVLVSIMKAPNTFTKENIVEINCHGGIISTNKVLEAVLANGAHLPDPGEFTKRAFLNGRLDLSQAESIIDIITSKTDLSRQSAVNQLEGSLSGKISALKAKIMEILSHIEVNIDYPEYDIEQITMPKIEEKVIEVLEDVKLLLATADTGKIIREGIPTAIVGKPNVGKSSLLNALTHEQRAIVTNIPGTTRDTIEEYVNLHGVPLKLIDTAGIRETNDVVEQIGVDRSKRAISAAELVLWVLDSSSPLTSEDDSILRRIVNKKYIVVLNKCDLPTQLDMELLKSLVDDSPIVKISTTTQNGLIELENIIKNMFMTENLNVDNDVIITNNRHKNALLKAKESLSSLLSSMDLGMTQDFLSIDLQNAYRYLGEITGESMNEDMIKDIFSRFCLGK